MDSYHPIACDLHDYLEIACLYRYRLLLELEDGVRFEAEARTTHTRAVRPGGGKEEYLEVAVEGATLLLRWIACWRLPPSRKRPCSAAYA